MMKGFTLIEVAIVIFVIGLLASELIPIVKISHERNVRALTELELSEAAESIYGFVIVNKRLPCPDVNGDYLEDTTASGCVALSGGVPSATLGLQQRVAYDGRQYQMEVDNRYVKSDSMKGVPSFSKITSQQINDSNLGLATISGMNLSARASYYVMADRLKTRF